MCIMTVGFRQLSIDYYPTTGSITSLVKESDVAQNSSQCQSRSDEKVPATLGVFLSPAEKKIFRHAGASRP